MSEAKQAKSWKDSNVALIGSDEDLEARVKAAKTEKEYKGAGAKVGVEIWRVEKLNIKKWPKTRYGTFYDGDSYIVLNTYKKSGSNKLRWDVFFWLGVSTTQDEMGVAAYKTVELDDLLGTEPVQHREVQGFESKKFLELFKDKFHILSGGIASGFNQVKPEAFKPKLLHIKGKKNIRVKEVPCTWKSLNVGDSFILDAGLTVYIWLPKGAGRGEIFKASQVAQQIKNSRKNVTVERLEEEGNDFFWKTLGGGKGKKLAEATSDNEKLIKKESNRNHVLMRLSDASGKLKFEKVSEGKSFNKKDLDSDDVFIADLGDSLYVWIGSKASKNEKARAMFSASAYLGLNKRPAWIRVTRLIEGQSEPAFDKHFK